MKILMVLTSHDRLGDSGKPTGSWLEQFAAPYCVFKDAGGLCQAVVQSATAKPGHQIRPLLKTRSVEVTRSLERISEATSLNKATAR